MVSITDNNRFITRVIVTSLALLPCLSSAVEFSRNIYMNGEKLNALNIAVFDVQIGGALPDGRYWYDPVSGDWGVEGYADPIGNFYSGALYQSAAGQPEGGDNVEGEISNSVNGTAGTGRDAEGRNCAFVSIPGGEGMMTCD